MLVSDDVRRVGDSITEIISDLCSNTPKDSRLFLNAPDYLFVSTSLAKKFPTLMESIVVQSYFSHVPGGLSKRWNVGSVARIRRYHNLRHITLLTTILGSIQYFGTLPFMLHRLFIRFIQPFVFGGLVVLWTIIISSPIYVALMSLLLGILLAFGIYKYLYGVDSLNKLSPITPIVDEGVNEINDVSKNDYGDDLDNQILVHLDLDEFQQRRDDKDSSNESSSVHNNDFNSDAVSENSNDGIISMIGLSVESDKSDDDSNLSSSLVSGIDSSHSSVLFLSNRNSVENQSNSI